MKKVCNIAPRSGRSDIDTPHDVDSELKGILPSPSSVENIESESIGAPDSVASKAGSQIDSPEDVSTVLSLPLGSPGEVSSVEEEAMDSPALMQSIPAILEPPFPLTHARILYDNLLLDGEVDHQPNGYFALTQNTYERFNIRLSGVTVTPKPWPPHPGGGVEDDGLSNFTVTVPESRLMDCFCIGASKIRGCGISFHYSPSLSGDDWIQIHSEIPEDDRAIMVLTESKVSVRRFRISFQDVQQSGMMRISVGYVSAGVALQMQRPLFGGHSPMSLSRVTEYQSGVSDGGNWLSRSVVRRGLSGDFSWDKLTDEWYREYFDPFVMKARTDLFFIKWRPSYAPRDCVLAWTTSDITPSYMGIRDLVSVSMSVSGYGDV